MFAKHSVYVLGDKMSEALYSCDGKFLEGMQGAPKRDTRWIKARRGSFSIYPDFLKLHDETIDNDDITAIRLYPIKGWLFRYSTFEIQAQGKSYHVGVNPWAHPEKFITLPVEKMAATRLSGSAYSKIRILVLCALVSYMGYTLI